MNRGSHDRAKLHAPRAAGFNEAPIHESGKSASCPASPDTPRKRFNEAPIHESGKYELLGHALRRIAHASMRPRFMNRGSATQADPSDQAAISFNEAPIHESGKSWPWQPLASNRSTGFNEAPIHESGKYYVARPAEGVLVDGFNEAPIHESGKSCPGHGGECPNRSLQ